MRGGEKVLEALCEMFPEADVFTHVIDREAVSEVITARPIRTTFIQKLPRSSKWYQGYLPLMPLALEQLDLRGYDLVISSESGPAKGVIVQPDAVHVCYCHTPMRYLWDLCHEYARSSGRITRFVMPSAMHYLRIWDVSTAMRVDQFIANSHYVAARIRKFYRREAEVVFPPVDTAAFANEQEPGDFYLMVGQLTGYKLPQVAIRAFNQLKRRLVVVGEGDLLDDLRALARPNIEFLGWQATDKVTSLVGRCRALIFPALEDFGIVPVEAMAAGRPVIAYGRGGARETVIDGRTGILYDEPTPEALVTAIQRFETMDGHFRPREIAEYAKQFDRSVFMSRMRAVIDEAIATHVARLRSATLTVGTRAASHGVVDTAQR
jgi:glycosyltransferase involved in cell wall biosynthesis